MKKYLIILVVLLALYFTKTISFYDSTGFRVVRRGTPFSGDTVPDSVCVGPHVKGKKSPPGGYCAIDTVENAKKMCLASPDCGGFTEFRSGPRWKPNTQDLLFDKSDPWIPDAEAQLFNNLSAKSIPALNLGWNSWIKL